MKALIDTSFLLALFNARDKNYSSAVELFTHSPLSFVIPSPIFPELFYMATQRIGYAQAVQIHETLVNSNYHIESLALADHHRISSILNQYMDARFDFVDTSIMALSERLNITRVFTFDRRDFPIFRPSHSDALELLP